MEQALIDRLRRRLAAGQIGPPSGDDRVLPAGPTLPAAVLVPIVLRAEGATVLLTQRTSHLRDHAGQVSFPGGRMESHDAGPEATALRETTEEIGLAHHHVELIGRLPEYRTITGYAVTPVVGLVTPPFELRPDEFEVAAIFEPPLAFLLDPANHRRHDIEVEGRRHHYWSMPWQGYNIWGATAGMLRSLCAIVGSDPQIG